MFLRLYLVEILMSADKPALLMMINTINSESIQVSADKVGKKNQFDLVELAAQVKLASASSYFASPLTSARHHHSHCQVQKADQFTRATAGSKLTVIAEQVALSFFCPSR